MLEGMSATTPEVFNHLHWFTCCSIDFACQAVEYEFTIACLSEVDQTLLDFELKYDTPWKELQEKYTIEAFDKDDESRGVKPLASVGGRLMLVAAGAIGVPIEKVQCVSPPGHRGAPPACASP